LLFPGLPIGGSKPGDVSAMIEEIGKNSSFPPSTAANVTLYQVLLQVLKARGVPETASVQNTLQRGKNTVSNCVGGPFKVSVCLYKMAIHPFATATRIYCS
jgi:hypothetical protein